MIRVELVKLFGRRRTWVAIGLLNLLPTLVCVFLAWTRIAPRPGQGPAFLSAVIANGSLFAIAALAIVLPLFLPIAVAVVAGESVAGEAQAGTLRYLLVRPVGRTRLLVAKLVAVVVFVLVGVVTVVGIGFVVGHLLLGDAPLSQAMVSISGSVLTPAQVIWRTVAAILLVAFSMLGVAAMALFLSTTTDSPLSATLGALAFLVGTSAADAAHPPLAAYRQAYLVLTAIAAAAALFTLTMPRGRVGAPAATGPRTASAVRRLRRPAAGVSSPPRR